jgi:hypothetical protein
MTRLDKLVSVMIRASIGAAAALALLGACAKEPRTATAPPEAQVDPAGGNISTDYDALYEEFAEA